MTNPMSKEPLDLPYGRVMELEEYATYAFQHYALFCWSIENRRSLYQTDDEARKLIENSEKKFKDAVAGGLPSSIRLILEGGYTYTPESTERLIALALVAGKPGLIPDILRAFPNTRDPIRLKSILQPITDPNISAYENSYLKSENLPPPGILRTLVSLCRTRLLQNQVIRDGIRIRYGLVGIVADPYLFNLSSMGDITLLLTKIDRAIIGNPDIYKPLEGAIETLKKNYEKVRNMVESGEMVTKDAIRRLKLILETDSAVDKLIGK